MGKKDKFADKKKAKEEAEAKALAAQLEASAALTPKTAAMTVVKPVKTVCREGEKGTKTSIEVNYFLMNVSKLIKEAYHYDLVFDPPGPKKFISRVLEIFRMKHFKDIVFAFDGRKNVYTDKKCKIKDDALEDSIELPIEADRTKVYKITMKLAAVVDLSVLKDYKNKAFDDAVVTTALQCVDIVLRCRFKNTAALPFGRQFYYPHERNPLGDGLELWRGLYQSAMLGTKSLYLNADVINKAVAVDMHVLDFVAQMNRGKIDASLKDWLQEKIVQHLKQLRVEYQPTPKKPPVSKLFYQLGKPASVQKFRLEDGRQLTVEQYFREKFGVTLKYPGLPLIQVMPAEKNIYLPMECCRIPGGQLNQKKCDLQKMILETAKPSHERKEMITKLSQTFSVNEDIKKFGIEIASTFEKVMARILKAPEIVYKNKVETPLPNNGTWKDSQFIFPSPCVAKYAIINCANVSFQVLVELKKSINSGSAKYGLKLEDPGSESVFNGGRIHIPKEMETFLEETLKICQEKKYTLVFVIVSDNNCYSKAKYIAETKVGILTQCLKTKSFYNSRDSRYQMSASTLFNIFLKINTKLNGVNHQIREPSYNTTVMSKEHHVMFIGADVTHPSSPEQRKTDPSVAAVCASIDRSGFRYNPIWRLQEPGSDLIADFEEIMVEQFHVFKGKNKNELPSKIIYYRDGVGESQFDKFIGPETDSLRRACTRMYGQKEHPEINIIVVNKRHHMRAFPSKNDGDGTKFNNVLPGTVVDKDIVSYKYFQFFLASHSAIQGCTKPTKYTVLLNESNINADDLQALTNCLCYMYVRCNRAVSYPNCTYYAHWMALRAKCYISGGAALDMKNLDQEYQTRASNKTVVNAHPMYFI